jgi:hypothetical protein
MERNAAACEGRRQWSMLSTMQPIREHRTDVGVEFDAQVYNRVVMLEYQTCQMRRPRRDSMFSPCGIRRHAAVTCVLARQLGMLLSSCF